MNKETKNIKDIIEQDKNHFFIFSMLTSFCAGTTFGNLIATIKNPDTLNIIATCICVLPLVYSGYKIYPTCKYLLKGKEKQR